MTTELQFAGFLWRKREVSAFASKWIKESWSATWYDGSRVDLDAAREKIAGRTRYTLNVRQGDETSWGMGLGTADNRAEAMAMALVAVARRAPFIQVAA
jgi:hypothetical protein